MADFEDKQQNKPGIKFIGLESDTDGRKFPQALEKALSKVKEPS